MQELLRGQVFCGEQKKIDVFFERAAYGQGLCSRVFSFFFLDVSVFFGWEGGSFCGSFTEDETPNVAVSRPGLFAVSSLMEAASGFVHLFRVL